jgi:hypothetical protein
MDTTQLLSHYLQAARDGRAVRFGDGERADEGQVESVQADTDGRRDYVKLTLKVRVPHESGSPE